MVEEVNGKWVMSHDPFSEALKVTKDKSSTASDRRKAVKDLRTFASVPSRSMRRTTC